MIPSGMRRPKGVYVVLLRGDLELARWPLANGACPDVGLVGELARLQLTAMRMGCAIAVRDASPQLAGLLELTGLAGLLGQVGGEAEEGEQLGVEKIVMPDDTVA